MEPSQIVTAFERELNAGLLLSFPYLVCHTGHHQTWFECTCVESETLWYCESHKRWGTCCQCDPSGCSRNNAQIQWLLCGYKFGLPEQLEITPDQWLTATENKDKLWFSEYYGIYWELFLVLRHSLLTNQNQMFGKALALVTEVASQAVSPWSLAF